MPPFLCAALLVFFEGLVIWSVFPTMIYHLEALGGNVAWVGVLFALMSAPKIIMNPILGRLSDKYGRRPVLIVVMLGAIGGSVAWALAQDATWLAVSRTIAGVFAAQAALGQTIIADSTPPERRASAMGFVGAAFGLSMVLGPLLGGLVAKATGSYAAVGWACAAVQSVSLLVIIAFLPETNPRKTSGRPEVMPERARDAFTKPRVLRLLAVTFVMTLGMSELTATFASLGKGEYGWDPGRTGFLFAMLGTIALLTQGVAVRMMVPRLGEHTTALIGLVVLGLGLAVVGALPPIWLLWTAAGLIGAGSALAMPTLASLLSRSVGPAHQGSVLGLNQSMTAGGRALGAVLGGVLYEMWRHSAPYISAAGLMVVAVLILWPIRQPKSRDLETQAA